jgi:Fe-S-cluster containining protein
MKDYQKIDDKLLCFSSCQVCDARCCDGKRGSVYSDLLLSEFELVSDNFPILFLRDFLNYLQPVILLSDGSGYCRHLKDFRCSIYNARPSTCRVYPITPEINGDILIDLSCPAVGEVGKHIVNMGTISKGFDSHILHNYVDKFLDTYYQFIDYNKIENLDIAINIKGVNFYKFKDSMNNRFLDIHIKSLKNLDKVVVSNKS